jgi:hypothetical protein
VDGSGTGGSFCPDNAPKRASKRHYLDKNYEKGWVLAVEVRLAVELDLNLLA